MEYGSNILIEFDMIVDTEIGLLRLVREEYCDESVFYSGFLELDDHLLKGQMMERIEPNPLIVSMRDKNVDRADSYYKQFFEKRYDDILARSCSTALLKLVKRFIDTEGVIRVTILCEDEKQKLIIRELFKDCLMSLLNIEVIKDGVYDVERFTELFIRDVRRLPRYQNVSGKTIYLARYHHNLDPQLMEQKILYPIREYAILYGSVNQFKTVTLYNYDNSYSITGDYIEEFDETTDNVDIRKLEEEQMDNKGFIERVFGPGYLKS